MSNTTALARKFRVEVSTDLTLAGGWVQVNGIYALKPTADPNTVDTSAYDTDGWDSFEITGNAWGLTSSFWRRVSGGSYDAGQEIIRACVGKFGDAARVAVRWFDKDGGPEAYQGVAIVKWERANDGVKDADAATVTLMGDGVRYEIANPGTAAAAPVVTAAAPSGAAQDQIVTVSGSGFLGATDVSFGGVSATAFHVLSDSTLVATVPAGSAGSAPVTVTNAVGTSSSFAYTRGA